MDIRSLAFFVSMTPLLGGAGPQGSPSEDREGLDFFEKKIRPVLAERCYSCHSAKSEKLKGGLFLDSREGLRKGGASGVAIVPGDPDQSRLIHAIRYGDEDLRMPPKGRLTAEQVADFEAWVRRGAPDPRTGTALATPSRDHWAFRPARNVTPPSLRNSQSSVRNEIDRFILAKLEQKELRPAPPAGRRTLLRRATFDLIGLPPAPEEISAFESDGSPDAFARVVDRLLASPQYGERWGRHWLDVARYADTKGYIFDERRFAYSWAYRDWVIRAFNEDMPYDRFVTLQIAADQVAQDPRDLAALGFLTIGRRFLNNVPDIIDDRLDVVFRGFQGLSIGCARCHDHKYDPIPTQDYYSLYGVFASCNEPDEPPLAGAPRESPSYQAYLKERSSREEELSNFRDTRGSGVVAELKTPARIAEYLRAAHEMRALTELELRPEAKRRKLNPAVLPRWWFFLKKTIENRDPLFAPWHAFAAGKSVPEGADPEAARVFAVKPAATLQEAAERYGEILAGRDDVLTAILFDPSPLIENLFYPDGGPIRKKPKYPVDLLFDEPDLKKLKDLQNKVKELEFSHAGAPARAMVLEDGEPVTPRVFIRGNKATPGEEVPRRFLSALTPGERKPFTQGSGRLELARAIAHRDNPLTARVMVNRIWLHHFGAGIVRTPSDFGLRCEPPTHPELLDWLASRFAESGSIKSMHRLIMNSSVYQQRSEGDPETARADPENLLLGRMNPRRLDLEALRDSLLMVAGRLDRTAGGRGGDIATSRRRTVYASIDRNKMPGLFRTFDFANPDTHVPQRVLTTVPQQALFLMNSSFILDQARGLANRPDLVKLEPAKRVERMYGLLFGRLPTAREADLGLAFVRAPEPACGETCDCGSLTAPLTAWEKYAQVLLQSNEFNYVD